MDIKKEIGKVKEADLQDNICDFLSTFVTPAFGSLPKREIELCVFDLMVKLGILKPEATIYSLMTDLKITRTKASQLLFDLEIRRNGSDKKRLDDLVKDALIHAKFAKDNNYFVMEIENPLTLAHMRQKIRENGHFSDTSFNSDLIRAPLDAVTDLMLDIIPKEKHKEVENALVEAGAQGSGFKAVIKTSLKTLGRKFMGEAADQVIDGSENFLGSLLDAVPDQMRKQWVELFTTHKNDGS